METVNSQRGIALVSAIVMILIMSGLAVALMTSSSLDTKRSTSQELSTIALKQVQADTERVIAAEVYEQASSHFYKTNNDANAAKNVVQGNTTASFNNANTNLMEPLLPCPRRSAASSVVKCNYTRIESSLPYGKGNRHQAIVVTGMVQEMGH